MPVNRFDKFFKPKGIVIAGARRSPGFGYGIPLFLQNHGWGKRMYLVNPAAGDLHGQTVYKRVKDVPASADLAIVIVPAPAVPGIMEDIGKHRIKHVIIETAGFGETDEKGKALQEQVKAIAIRYGIRVIGPNCVGVVNTANRFASVELIDESLVPGPVSIIAQSGVFGNILLDYLPECGLSISKAITLGNRLDVNESDMLDYLNDDPATRVILLYLEGAADGLRLRETLARVTRNKPVIILKSGRTDAGKLATASHTGSMSGQDAIYKGLFAQTGAIRAESLSELIDLARVFATQPAPRGNRLGIITNSGSLGALATDVAVSSGLTLPPPSSSMMKQVREIAPDWMNIKNPLDLGPSGIYGSALPIFLANPEIDMALVIIVLPYAVASKFKTMGMTEEDWFGDIELIRSQYPHKPLLNIVIGHHQFVADITRLSGRSTPVFSSPEQAARALSVLWRYSKARNKSQHPPLKGVA
jgi:acyl-CoA synthetase (NDP forming)